MVRIDDDAQNYISPTQFKFINLMVSTESKIQLHHAFGLFCD